MSFREPSPLGSRLPLFAFLCSSVLAQRSLYQPCPLLGPWVPTPTIDANSPTLRGLSSQLNQQFSNYVAAGDGKYGPITPNTTSFSIALFAAGNRAALSGEKPFFYEYNHAASGPGCAGSTTLDSSAKFPIGDLTQLITVYAQLATLGDKVWAEAVTSYLPDVQARNGNVLKQVQWQDVTLGALAGHMAGITRSSSACTVDRPCNADRLVEALRNTVPVELPDTTPIYSNAAFQLIAASMEAEMDQPFSDILSKKLLTPLKMSSSSLLSRKTEPYGCGLTNSSLVGEPAALGLVSTLVDLTRLGRSILKSQLLSLATTRRWLKPFTSTSNLRNSVGRPWEIYHYGNRSTDPIIDIYTKSGSIGRYSSYFGIAPDFDLGFVILAVDAVSPAPDLNAYADLVLDALFPLQELGLLQANTSLAGLYRASSYGGNSTLAVGSVGALPGLPVKQLVVNGTDWLANIAKVSGIAPADLDMRLYPTNLIVDAGNGTQRAFRAVIQDQNALVDAGTPTCVSWQTVDRLRRNQEPLDLFVFDLDSNGRATVVTSPALDTTFKRS